MLDSHKIFLLEFNSSGTPFPVVSLIRLFFPEIRRLGFRDAVLNDRLFLYIYIIVNFFDYLRVYFNFFLFFCFLDRDLIA